MSPRTLLTALLLALGLVLTTLPSTAVAGSREYGRAWRTDGTLRPGCFDYRFQYRVRPGNVLEGSGDDWAAEFFLTDRRGKGLGTAVKDSAVDPRRGRGSYEVCRQTTVPGRFKIRGKLSVYDDGQLVDEVWVKPGYFLLTRP
jgi:hypothetical protein